MVGMYEIVGSGCNTDLDTSNNCPAYSLDGVHKASVGAWFNGTFAKTKTKSLVTEPDEF